MITFDAEDDGRGTMFLLGMYDGKDYISFELKDYKHLTDMREAIILYIMNSKEKIFVAHNLEYDLAHIFQGSYISILDWYYTTDLLFAKIPDTQKKFIDSFHFSYCSLKELAKEIKTKKGIVDIENISELYKTEPGKVKEYNKQDCKIVYDYMQKYIESVKFEFNTKIKTTLSGTAQNIFLKKFCKYDITGINVDHKLLTGYHGGRVECFYVGQVDRPIFELDVNSMYPYVMVNEKYPTTCFHTSIKPETELHISRIKVKIKDCYFPVIPLKKEKLFFPTGEFETTASCVEIQKAIAENQVESIKYIKTYNFSDCDYIFKKFINYFYGKRKIAKDNKNEFDSGYYKRIMNHVYGRFALNKPLKKLTKITAKNEDHIEAINDFIGYETLEMSDKMKNYAIPIFVTAYARVKLYDMIKTVMKKFDPIYCDTDSCYFTNFDYVPLMDMIDNVYSLFKIDNELGNYSLACYESGIFYNVKAYMLNSYTDLKKLKLKGVRKDKRQEFFDTGKTEYKKPVRMRSALRGVQGYVVNAWELHPFTRKSVYSKRELIKESATLYSTKPLQMELK